MPAEPRRSVVRGSNTIEGTIRDIDQKKYRLTLEVGDKRRVTVDMYSAFVYHTDNRRGFLSDLQTGQRVRISGVQVEGAPLEAYSIRLLLPKNRQETPRAEGGQVQIGGVVRDVDTRNARATVADAEGRRYIVDYLDADLKDAEARPLGRRAFLERGMRVEVVGTPVSRAVIIADTVQILTPIEDRQPSSRTTIDPLPAVQIPTPDALYPGRTHTTAPTPPAAITITVNESVVATPLTPSLAKPLIPSPDPRTTLKNLEAYTGVLIDTRHLRGIVRSYSPRIVGPRPERVTLYPDPRRVPTPDEVQEASVVRYYRTLEEANRGVCGPNPLIIPAQALVDNDGDTNYGDAVEVSGADMVLLIALDNRIDFIGSWRVGFLLPAGK